MSEANNKPGVLIIVENLPVPLDRRVWQESCALRDLGYDVTVICPQMRGYTRAEEVLEGIQVFRHPIAEEASGIKGFIREYWSALQGERHCARLAWKRRPFQIIHLCNPPDLLFLVALQYWLFHGVRVLFDVHDLWPEMFEAKFGKRGLLYWAVRVAERMTLALSRVVIATNESVLAAVKRRGGKQDEDVFVVRTSPKLPKTDVPIDRSLAKGRTFLVGYVGVMGNADGVDCLVRAAHHLVTTRKRSDIQFLLMGTGPEFEALVKLRDELGLREHMDMPGHVTNEFLFSALKTMDCGVACDPINDYNDHCTMNKTLEYMAFGKPQVMFGTREGRVSAGESAVYVMEHSAEQLGDAIGDLLDDPEKCRRLGETGHYRLHHVLNWERSVEKLAAAYDRVLA